MRRSSVFPAAAFASWLKGLEGTERGDGVGTALLIGFEPTTGFNLRVLEGTDCDADGPRDSATIASTSATPLGAATPVSTMSTGS